jgi:hypothetical protein
VTLHVPDARVQVVELKVPVLLEVNVIVPVGITAPVPEASATVAVQVVATLSRTLAGLQDTVELLARIVEASVKVPLLVL